MSWSISYIGKPSAVAKALDAYMADAQPSQSKDEYDAAKPHLLALVNENVGQNMVTISANGHATFTDVDGVKTKTYGYCTVSLSALSGNLVLD